LSPAKVKEVRIDVETGTATVIVPDFQLSLAIGKEGQNARLAARLTGWRVDIKSETQLADEEAYAGEEWAQGEWVADPETGEQVWVPAEGGPALSAEEWAHAGDDAPEVPVDEADEAEEALEGQEPEELTSDQPEVRADEESIAEEDAAERAAAEEAADASAPDDEPAGA
jgi:N utilization substance protein A